MLGVGLGELTYNYNKKFQILNRNRDTDDTVLGPWDRLGSLTQSIGDFPTLGGSRHTG